mmetsp:Transcript_12444/g.37415  ORF Transcript_12444/g.37415 Transcript_12444/m.37415 type:complete len:231 (+) Transcript_12444:214-906(+)
MSCSINAQDFRNTEPAAEEEHLDVLDEAGNPTGQSKPRSGVHADGDYHLAVHVWVVCGATGEVLLQQRALHKDSFAGLWDISAAGHVSAGDKARSTALRETAEEVGLCVPEEALEHACRSVHHSVSNGGRHIENEHNEVYIITLLDRPPPEAFALQASEVAAVKWVPAQQLLSAVEREDPAYTPMVWDQPYKAMWELLRWRWDHPAPTSRTISVQLAGGHTTRIALPTQQ